MNRTTALPSAGALVLTVAGGIGTLAVVDRPAAVDPQAVIRYPSRSCAKTRHETSSNSFNPRNAIARIHESGER